MELVQSKLRPPWTRPGMVPRTALVERLLAASAAWGIWVVAPAGYGKTTLLTQWASRKSGGVGWVTVDQRDNDPAVLLSYLAAALDRLEPIDPGVFGALTAPGPWVLGTIVPRLATAVAAMTRPVALVVDNLEALTNRACLDAIAEVAACLPTGSQLALAAWTNPRLPKALVGTPGRVMAVGVEELRMDQDEARALLKGAGVQLSETETEALVRLTEGWPVGLYLAALARKARRTGGQQGETGAGFSGDDRLLADYLWAELLSHQPGSTVRFLTRASVLDRMCGPLCDAVLDASGSAGQLASLAGSNLLLVPLDQQQQQQQWYRYHHLFRGLLQAELKRREPEVVPQLQVRAAEWYEANGLPESAIGHAQAARDADRAARLVADLVQPAYDRGRVDTALRWVGWFDQEQIERYPQVAMVGALLHMLVGHPEDAERWAEAAERGLAAATLPEPGEVVALLALGRAFMCRHGVERMREDAELTLEGLTPDSPWRAPALLLEGIAYLLAGQADRADPILAAAVQVGTQQGALPAASAAVAERCILAMEREAWPEAETLAEQALGIVRAGHLGDYIMSPLVHAAAARTTLHNGDVQEAHLHLARAARPRPLLTYAIPQFAVQTLLELAHAYLALDDVTGARVVLREANAILRRRRDLGTLPVRAAQLFSQASRVRSDLVGASSLTRAELRLLPLLATHFTFREIGERLYISQNTVKRQAVFIYRKLGVASRSQAVQRAQQLGLLGE